MKPIELGLNGQYFVLLQYGFHLALHWGCCVMGCTCSSLLHQGLGLWEPTTLLHARVMVQRGR